MKCQYQYTRGPLADTKCNRKAIHSNKYFSFCDNCLKKLLVGVDYRIIDWLPCGVELTVYEINMFIDFDIKTFYHERETNLIIKFDEEDNPFVIGSLNGNDKLGYLTDQMIDICDYWQIPIAYEEDITNIDDY